MQKITLTCFALASPYNDLINLTILAFRQNKGVLCVHVAINIDGETEKDKSTTEVSPDVASLVMQLQQTAHAKSVCVVVYSVAAFDVLVELLLPGGCFFLFSDVMFTHKNFQNKN